MFSANLKGKGLMLKYASGSAYDNGGEIVGFGGYGVEPESLASLNAADLRYAIVAGIRQHRRMTVWVDPAAFRAAFVERLAPLSRRVWQIAFDGGDAVTVEAAMLSSEVVLYGGTLIYRLLMEPVTAPVVVSGDVSLPVVVTDPTVTGAAVIGGTVTCVPGTYDNGPVELSWQWRWADTGAAISGADQPDYNPVLSDLGHPLACTETATNVAGPISTSTTATAPVSAPVPNAPVNLTPPVITGSTLLFETLTCGGDTWANSPTSITRQWFRHDTNFLIPDADQANYTSVAEDFGHPLRCDTTATNAGGSVTVSSQPTTPITDLTGAETLTLRRGGVAFKTSISNLEAA
ncbi:hypothetical protein Q1W73_16430 [Asticcacaulis sp. ZE23SCel15]|uniref:hypothetical protein n=1 Tax=Asticcacaulis sp. ZE23SCel15 TaxID=3059027 RepID=UPI00265D9319|nr:hypothetical protein [Asticcacaulis sp. ZE23SCel15]WKL57230.1 hypothetical protein Q1W73_16430 [Asticcacaulis sp. ZE23SCel15]